MQEAAAYGDDKAYPETKCYPVMARTKKAAYGWMTVKS